MKALYKWLLAAGLLCATQANAFKTSYSEDEIPLLRQEPQHAIVSDRVTARFTRSHYRRFDLDDAFSEKIFARYLNMLDYNHSVLLQSDVAQFAVNKTKLGDALRSGKLTFFYDLFNLAQKRRFERYRYALDVLARPMNFSGDDTIDIDRSKAPWPTNVAELNTLWDARVKLDELNLKLTGKDEKTIREVLSRRYQSAIRRLTQNNSEDVFQLAMNAFAHEIDPHTNYLSPRITEQFNSEMSLSFEGIGAVLQLVDEYTIINAMTPGGPAAKSKALKVGDRIIGVAEQGKPIEDVVGWRLDDIVAKIKGPKGSKVKLEILPANKTTKAHIVTLTREKIRLEDRAVKMRVSRVGKHKIGVLTVPGFYVGLSNDVKLQLQKMQKQQVSSVIIDLRNNGGGALTEAVALSGLFIPSGPVVQARDNNGQIRVDKDSDDKTYYAGPLVVLVNRFSASASEIFAAAMQDYGRALIVGEPTFGKGTVQQYRTLNRIYDYMLRPNWPVLGSVQYTIQKFYRINGDSTQRKGVTPHLLLPSAKEITETGEKYEDNALPWDSISAVSFEKQGDIGRWVPQLTALHTARIAHNRELVYVNQYIEQQNRVFKTNKRVSLNFAKREKENRDEADLRLKLINVRYQAEGKKSLTSLEQLPKDYKESDIYLEETKNIAADLATMR